MKARLTLGLAVVVLLVAAWLGIRGGVQQWPQSHTVGQRFQTLTQLLYGVCSILTIASVSFPATLARVVRAIWLANITLAGGAATIVWGDTGWATGVVAGIASFGVGVLILWTLAKGRLRSDGTAPA
jgi:ABC-type arginine transport system permease subunit